MLDYLTTMFLQLRWVDIVDIAIIAFAIYKILKFIQETRAAQLLKGLIVLLVATVLSDVFKLYTINWLLDSLLKVGVIALIVIFQPEIRRGLQYLGSRGMMRGRNFVVTDSEEADKITSEIMGALKGLSKSKTGALIILERTTVLGEVQESGTEINSKISKELLMNIFYPGAPLHDGAVIIRGDKIEAAACVLPLTSNNNLSSDLGTRHRAGIGITEVSDAVAVIVSEETGTMSAAINGHISRFLDDNAMETIVRGVFANEGSGKKYLFGQVFNKSKGKESGEEDS